MDWVTAVHACVDLHESYLQGAKGKLGERLTFCSKLEDIDVEITTIIGDGDFIINIFNITHTGMKNIEEIYRKYDKMIFEFKNRYVKFIKISLSLGKDKYHALKTSYENCYILASKNYHIMNKNKVILKGDNHLSII